MRVRLPNLLAIMGLLREIGSDFPTRKVSIERMVLGLIVDVPCLI